VESFEGRATVITGGANGIGFATAKEFGRRGARVMLGDIDQAALDGAVAVLRADGVDAHGVVCDVRKLDAVTNLADEAFRVFGDVHVVFNNAGIAYAGPIVETSHDDWRFVVDVDLWGPIHGVEAFLPRLREQGGDRHIMFTSSFAGMVGNAYLGPYSVAKFGVVALAEGLSRELKAEGIGVSVLCPMIVETNINANSLRNRPKDLRNPDHTDQPPDIEAGSMVGSVIPPDEVGRRVVRAIDRNDFYVLTHPEQREILGRRARKQDKMFEPDVW